MHILESSEIIRNTKNVIDSFSRKLGCQSTATKTFNSGTELTELQLKTWQNTCLTIFSAVTQLLLNEFNSFL